MTKSTFRAFLAALLALASLAGAQGPWQHELHSVFPEPFSFLLLPWEGHVEQREMDTCWREGQAPPFLGADYRFLCFTLPAEANAHELRIAFRDAGYLRGRGLDVSYLESPLFFLWDVFHRIESSQTVNAWYFEHPEGAFLSFGYSPF